MTDSDLTGSELSHYRIKKLLGRGGMGEVYLAEDTKLKREVAVKILPFNQTEDKKALQRFKTEALAAAALRHPNVCVIHELGETDGRFFIAMELCEGETLHQRIQSSNMNVDEVIAISLQIAEALEEARKKNIVHRDIKPSNIMIEERNHVKILDFGLARRDPEVNAEFSQEETASKLTATGAVVGTFAYMSPEQALGKIADHRSDIFSFGVVMYQMLAGRVPFSGKTAGELINSIVNTSPQPVTRFVDQVPDGLIRIIQKTLEKDPDRRYQSAKELWIDLDQVRREKDTPAANKSVPVVKRRSILFVSAAVAILILGIATYLYTRKTPQASTVVTISHNPAVVALPCKVFGASELEYLTDAVPSTLSTFLGRIPGIDTKAPPSSVEVNQVRGELSTLAKLYQVNYFLLSSITAEQTNFAINLQMVEPDTRRVIWSNRFEGSRDRYIELLERAANEIRQKLVPTTPTLVSSQLPASSSEGELAYHRGLYFAKRYNLSRQDKDFENSLEALNQAIKLDPKRADAPARIAFLYAYKLEGQDNEEIFQLVQLWAQRALQIDSENSTAYSALWNAELVHGAPRDKLIELALKAIQYSPSDETGHEFLAITLYSSGALLAAKQGFLEASRRDPLYFYPDTLYADTIYMEGKAEQALEKLNRVLSMQPDMSYARWQKTFYLIELGRLQEAESLLTGLKESKEIDGDLMIMARLVYALAKDESKEAEVLFNDQLRESEKRNDEFYWQPLFIYVVPNLVKYDRMDDAYYLLKTGSKYDQHLPYDYMMMNPYLKRIKSDPKFKDFVQSSREECEQTLLQLEDARAQRILPEYLEESVSELKRQLAASK